MSYLSISISAFSIGFKGINCNYAFKESLNRRARVARQGTVNVLAPANGVSASKMSTINQPEKTASKLEDFFWNWNGYKIRYQASGLENKQGPSILLVHGFGGNADHWRKNTPNLAIMANARVYAIDLIGYGYSDKPDPQAMQAVNGELRRDLDSYARFAPKVIYSGLLRETPIGRDRQDLCR